MMVEGRGRIFRTRVQIPPGPLSVSFGHEKGGKARYIFHGVVRFFCLANYRQNDILSFFLREAGFFIRKIHENP